MASSMGGEGGSCDNHQHQFLHHLMSEDVLIQILLCLPVTSLLRFKSVCKSWLSIIQSTFFIHLHVTTKLGGSSVLFNRGEAPHKEEENKGKLFTLSGDEFQVFEDLGRPPLVGLGEEFEELNRRFSGCMKFCVVGCCNGIICLHDVFSRNIILWNPAIKQSRVVPKPSNLLGNPNCFKKGFLNPHDDDGYFSEDVVIFGVDFKTKDYKVLLLTTLLPEEIYYRGGSDDDEAQWSMRRHSLRGARRVHVYSLSTDSWRCIDITLSAAYPDLLINKYAIQGIHLSGSHILMASCLIKVQEYFCTMPLILSLDLSHLTEEIFKTIHPPYDWRNKKTSGFMWNYFIPFGEKLALVDGFEHKCNVWVLNEQHSGVKESWTKLYTLEHPYMSPIRLRGIAYNEQFAIYNGQKLRLLNLITRETKDLQSDCQGLQVDFDGGIYRPSLVQIGRSGATNEKCDGTL